MVRLATVLRSALVGAAAAGIVLTLSCGMLPGTDGDSSNTDGTAPVVALTVSNPTPQVNEQVSLICTAIAGTGVGMTFDFQPFDGRLIVNQTTGLAVLVVSEQDAGAALTYTCTAANADGTSQPSAPVTIFPMR